MIEVTLITYLMGKTSAGNNVFAERQEQSPGLYILIDKTGSSVDDKIPTSTIAIQSVSDSMQGGSMLTAMTLNDEVKQVMDDLIARDDIVKVRLTSDYNYTDDSTKEYRYQAVYEITHY